MCKSDKDNRIFWMRTMSVFNAGISGMVQGNPYVSYSDEFVGQPQLIIGCNRSSTYKPIKRILQGGAIENINLR